MASMPSVAATGGISIKRLILTAIAAAVIGAGGAQAQTYREIYDKCETTNQKPADRVKNCDVALGRAQPDAKADRAMILLYRSTANLDIKAYDASIKDADEAALLLPRHLESQNQRCWTRGVANKDIAVGRGACDIALDISRSNCGVWDSSGLIALREGKWDRAWADYNEAVRIEPNHTSSFYGRGLAALAIGKTAESDADLKKAASSAAEYKGYGLTPETAKKRVAATPAPAAN
ncbi:MAG: hypothetical protein Q8R02_19405 [Hyphomonadaceae bacterium]|nr:hypothetical protein [Hyphomonadaceae bacterium]